MFLLEVEMIRQDFKTVYFYSFPWHIYFKYFFSIETIYLII